MKKIYSSIIAAYQLVEKAMSLQFFPSTENLNNLSKMQPVLVKISQ